jgi:hypothetical protein
MVVIERSLKTDRDSDKGIAERAIAVLDRGTASPVIDLPAAPLVASSQTARPLIVIASRKAAAPGELVVVPISLANTGSEPISACIACTDLVSASGDRIDAGRVSFDPQALQIPSGGTTTVPVLTSICIPADALAGLYAGLLDTQEKNAIPALLMVRVS